MWSIAILYYCCPPSLLESACKLSVTVCLQELYELSRTRSAFILFSSCAFATTWNSYYASNFGNNRCCCSGSLPTVEKWNSIWFFAEKLRNYLFSVKCQHYSYTNGQQPMPLVLGVNIPWGMPQAQELLLLVAPINSSNLHHQDGLACIRYILFKVKMFTWDPPKKKTILTRVFLCSTSIFLHAFLTGKTKAFITAAQKKKIASRHSPVYKARKKNAWCTNELCGIRPEKAKRPRPCHPEMARTTAVRISYHATTLL